MKGRKAFIKRKRGMGRKNVAEGQYSLLDRVGKRRTDKDNHTLGDGGRRE